MSKQTVAGVVVSNKMINTIVVAVSRLKVHPMYGKQFRVTKKYHVDTAGQQFNLGDQVKIQPVAPISKTKSWKVII